MPRKRPGTRVELEHVDQEIGELVASWRQARRRARSIAGSSAKQVGIVRLDHAAARAGRRHQVVAALEFGNELARERDARRRDRRSCRPAGRSKSARRARRLPRRRASSSLMAAKPIEGRIRSTRQVTKNPTRMRESGTRAAASESSRASVPSRATVHAQKCDWVSATRKGPSAAAAGCRGAAAPGR